MKTMLRMLIGLAAAALLPAAAMAEKVSYDYEAEKDVTVRTLTIDLQDAANEQLVWRGIGVATVHPTSKPSHVSRRVNHEVTKIFENYPPRGTVATLTSHRIQ